MRIQRTRRRDIDEFSDLIESPTACPSVLRISRKNDIGILGGFGNRPHWESHSYCSRMKSIGKKLAMSTHLYADHIGFVENKGFKKGDTDYYTYAENRINQHEDQPYPEIDKKTNVPIKLNTERDKGEQKLREDYQRYWGYDGNEKKRCRPHRLTEEQKELAKYCEKGIGLDLGCGGTKCHPNCIGVDIDYQSVATINTNVEDLWMFNNELDFIVNSHLLEHLKDPIAALKNWLKALKPGGIMAIAVPNGHKYPKFIIKNGHKSNFGMEELRLIFKFILKIKIIELKLISNNKGEDRVILIIGKKIN